MCVLCGGYFIDATTIIECLHSCKYDRALRVFPQPLPSFPGIPGTHTKKKIPPKPKPPEGLGTDTLLLTDGRGSRCSSRGTDFLRTALRSLLK